MATPVYTPYQSPKKLERYCRQRAREAQDYYTELRWLDLAHRAHMEGR